MKRNSLLTVMVLCLALVPLGGCEWLNSPPDDLQAGTDVVRKAVDDAQAEIDRLQREADALREKEAKTAEDFAMLARVDDALTKARDVHGDAQDLLDDWQARLDAAPTNGDLLAGAASQYANLLFPGAGILVALGAGWLREWNKKKQAEAAIATVVQNIDAAKVPSSEVRGADRKLQTISVDMSKLAALNAAAGVEEVVEDARK